jgi:thiol:disulfide interchange protein DsbD
MKHIFALILSALFILSAKAGASESPPVDTGKVVAQLVSSHESAAPGQTIQIALRTVLDDKWHTYWRNPGDSGEPVQIDWRLPDGAAAGDIVWPLPSAIPTGPIINYGFEGIPYFPVPVTLPENALPGSVVTIEAGVYYLVCYDVCIPESADLALDIEIGPSVENSRWSAAINLAINDAPKPASLPASISAANDQVTINIADLPEGDFSNAFFFPYDQGVIRPGDPQVLTAGSRGIALTAGADYAWSNDLPEAFEGVLRYRQNGQDTGISLRLEVGGDVNIGAASSAPIVSEAGGPTFWGAAIGAFLGGLILNLMPCVFPVISIKALSLAKSAHTDREKIRREGWLYTAGVLVTFFLLALVLLAVKQAGANIGWGFQLQSPKVVAILALLLFAIGLNLLGVFEIGSSLQNTGSGLAARGGSSGAFFTGALAVIVATPCTAPFMGGAVFYALSQPPVIMITVFMALAIGFALPFLLLAYMPALLARLPKPGPWMVRFREFLAFPMLAAAIWLVWVLSQQSGAGGVLLALSAMLLFAFALWLGKRGRAGKVLAVLSLIAALALPLTAARAAPVIGAPAIGQLSANAAQNGKIEKRPWSPAEVSRLRAEGKTVFVNFTAAWCVSCKVNERVVLNTPNTKSLFDEANAVFLLADWTNKNEEIAAELSRHGRSGVPLYLVYPPGHDPVSPAILPQFLSQNVLRDALIGK